MPTLYETRRVFVNSSVRMGCV